MEAPLKKSLHRNVFKVLKKGPRWSSYFYKVEMQQVETGEQYSRALVTPGLYLFFKCAWFQKLQMHIFLRTLFSKSGCTHVYVLVNLDCHPYHL